MFAWVGKILKVDLTSEKITEVPSTDYFPKFLGGRGFIAKVIWDEVPAGTKAFDPENRLVFAPSALTGTNSPLNGRWNIGSLAPQHPKEYPSHSGIGGHWAAELKFAGYDGIIVYGRASKPVYILIRDEDVEIRNASHLWGMSAIESQKRIAEEIAKEGRIAPDIAAPKQPGGYDPRMVRSKEEILLPDMSEWRQAGRYDPRLIRSVVIGPAGENSSRIASILHDSGDAAGQGGFGGVMGSKNLKAIAVRGTGLVKVARPAEMVETVFKARKLLRAKAAPIVPAYGGPGGIYGGDPKILTGHMKRLDGCFGCQVICRAYITPPGMTPGQAQCVQLQMYYNWEGVGPVAPLHPDFVDREQDETTWYGVKLADHLTINSFELTGILSWLWACYKEGILSEENTGILIQDMGSKEFADELFGMIARREGEFGDLLADGLHRAAEKLRERFGDRVWELYEERYVAHGQRQHWFYIGNAKGPADQTGYPNPVGQLLWATYTRD
ncbi:MAG: aldehyde ferredoxin oxidoreductase N-terminal domain-containing protein, partial [Nitrososphaerales archaeon]